MWLIVTIILKFETFHCDSIFLRIQVIASLGICKTLAEGIGSQVARYKGVLLPNMMNTMVDAKVLSYHMKSITPGGAYNFWKSKGRFQKEYILLIFKATDITKMLFPASQLLKTITLASSKI